jgi:excisionase family DNA binding protein
VSVSSQSNTPPRILRVNNVAKRLGLPKRTVRYMAAHGRIPAFKPGRRAWFFNAVEIEAYTADAARQEWA